MGTIIKFVMKLSSNSDKSRAPSIEPISEVSIEESRMGVKTRRSPDGVRVNVNTRKLERVRASTLEYVKSNSNNNFLSNMTTIDDKRSSSTNVLRNLKLVNSNEVVDKPERVYNPSRGSIGELEELSDSLVVSMARGNAIIRRANYVRQKCTGKRKHIPYKEMALHQIKMEDHIVSSYSMYKRMKIPRLEKRYSKLDFWDRDLGLILNLLIKELDDGKDATVDEFPFIYRELVMKTSKEIIKDLYWALNGSLSWVLAEEDLKTKLRSILLETVLDYMVVATVMSYKDKVFDIPGFVLRKDLLNKHKRVVMTNLGNCRDEIETSAIIVHLAHHLVRYYGIQFSSKINQMTTQDFEQSNFDISFCMNTICHRYYKKYKVDIRTNSVFNPMRELPYFDVDLESSNEEDLIIEPQGLTDSSLFEKLRVQLHLGKKDPFWKAILDSLIKIIKALWTKSGELLYGLSSLNFSSLFSESRDEPIDKKIIDLLVQPQSKDGTEKPVMVPLFTQKSYMTLLGSLITSFEKIMGRKLDVAASFFKKWRKRYSSSWSLLEVLTNGVCYIVDYIYYHFTGEHTSFGPDSILLNKANKFLEDIHKWQEEGIFDQWKNDLTLIETIFVKLKEGHGILRDLYNLESQRYALAFRDNLRQLERVVDSINRFKTTSPARNEPVVILFTGEPGSGKSTTMDALSPFLCKLSGIEGDPKLQRFDRKVANVYWDGYRNQLITTMDDVFQIDDQKKRAEEAIEVIHAANSNPYPLHMSDIPDKCTTFFTSPFLFLSTNLPTLNIGLTEVDAFTRRITFAIRVEGRSEIGPIGQQFRVLRIKNDSKNSLSKLVYEPTEEVWDFPTLVTKIWEQHRAKVTSQNLYWDLAIKMAQEFKVDPQFGLSTIYEGITFPYRKLANLCSTVKDESQAWRGSFERFNEMSENTVEFFKDMYKNPKGTYLQVVAIAGGVATAVVGLVAAIKTVLLFFKSKSKAVVPLTKSYRPYNRAEAAYSGERFPKIISQSCTNLNNKQFSETLFRNVAKIYVGKYSSSIFFIGGRVGLAPKHMKFFIKDNQYGQLKQSHSDNLIDFNTNEVKIINIGDDSIDLIALVFTRSTIPKYRNLFDKFMFKKDLEKGVLDELVLMNWTGYCMMAQAVLNCRTWNAKASSVDGSIIYGANHYFVGNVNTEKGDCGNVYLSMSKFAARPLVGIHVGANSCIDNQGVGVLVYQELIQELVPYIEEVVEFPLSSEPSKILPQGLEIVGVLPKHLAVNARNSTLLRVSPLSGMLTKPMMAPAVLRPVNGVSPLNLALKKMLVNLKRIDDSFVNSLFDSIVVIDRSKKLLTFEESIKGTEDKVLHPISTKSSCGYPYILDRKKVGKRDFIWFDEEDNTYKWTETARELTEGLLNKYRKGTPSGIIWVDTLKDEKRPIEKIEALKTRIFVTPPFNFTLVCRMLCGNFIAALREQRSHSPIKIGINCHSMEWTGLYNYLTELTDNPLWIAGDYSSFDGSISPSVGYGICRLINRWYDDEYQHVRLNLFDDIINPTHLTENTLFRVFGGNPSGCAITAEFNSLANLFLIRMAWFLGCIERNLDPYSFDSYIRVAVYGDDNLIAVHPSMHWFSMVYLKEFFKELGMQYGFASKDGKEAEFCTRDEITFLKRGFRLENGIYFAPLNELSIHESINWYHYGQPIEGVMAQEVDSYLRNWFHYGRERFEKQKNLVNKALVKVRLQQCNLTFERCMEDFLAS